MDVKSYIGHHLPWLVLVVCTVVGFHYWKAEHDAKVAAQITIAKDEAQIQETSKQINELKTQMQVRDAAAQQQITNLERIVSRVQTPAQVVSTLPAVVTLPSNPALQPDSSLVFPKEDVMPLFKALSDGKECGINLVQCTADLKDETQIAEKQVAITAQKDDEIKALRKKPSFWKRLGHDLKVIAIGAAAGALLVHGI